MPGPQEKHRFEIAFSTAGSHRETVRAIAELAARKLGREKVCYDDWLEEEILGPGMDARVRSFYREQSRLIVADLPGEAADRPWSRTEAEAIAALRAALGKSGEATDRLRLLEVRHAGENDPAASAGAGHLDAARKTPVQCADLILSRLDLLRKRMGADAPALLPLNPPPPILFFHPAAGDECFSRREDELAWLDRCAANPRIGAAIVTGGAGLGKTALVGNWIGAREGWRHRKFRGVFFYSFRFDRRPERFCDAFLKFVCKPEEFWHLPKSAPGFRLAAAVLRQRPCLIVMDGLEVFQGDEDGSIDDPDLHEFIVRAGQEGASLLILTSRRPLPAIAAALPDAADALELPPFDPADGAALLEKCGLHGGPEKLAVCSARFEHHPLALRLFASACQAAPPGDPEEASLALAGDSGAIALKDLLGWFQKKLRPPKRRLLQIVSLFSEPAATPVIVDLAVGLAAMRADFEGVVAPMLPALLEQLADRHLLERVCEPGGETLRWTVHPLVREVVRREALAGHRTVAAQFAEIVAGKDAAAVPATEAELQPILQVIEVLLAAGEFEAADRMYRERLNDGKAFLNIPAARDGLRCARGFLHPPDRRAAIEKALSPGDLAFYLCEEALRAGNLGQMEHVEKGYEEHNAIQHAARAWRFVSIGLRHRSLAQALRGALDEAIESAGEALFYIGVEEEDSPARGRIALARPAAVPDHDATEECYVRAYRAHALSLSGRLPAASREFAKADAIEREQHPQNFALYSLRGILWAHHRQRLGEAAIARALTLKNREHCQRSGWNATFARCELLLGELDLEDLALDSAAERITRAVRAFRDARQGHDLALALLALARVRRAIALAERDSREHPREAPPAPLEDSPFHAGLIGEESALAACEEALRRARLCSCSLMQCDVLSFRAQLFREAGEPDRAGEDARQALALAGRCGYSRGRRDALRECREASRAAGDSRAADDWEEAETKLAVEMQPLIEEALEINAAHDREMERLYGGITIAR